MRVLKKAARGAARAITKIRYPHGKVLARIRYFEIQRGLELTRAAPQGVRTGSITPTMPGRGKKAKAPREVARAPRVPYFAAAYAKARLEPPTFAAATDLPVWRELGPLHVPRGQTYGKGGNNRPAVSGRCVGVVIDRGDRRRLVVASAGGGLWGSNDAGATWRPLTDYQPTLAMGAIAAAPSSPNIVYAGTGEGDTRSPLGVGLLRSSDGGATWTLVPSAALTGTGIYDIAIDPTDPMHIWIGAWTGLFESRNGGTSVTALRSGLTWDISINPTDAQEIFVASDAGLLRSANGGGTWSRVALPGAPSIQFDRMAVCHAPSSPAVVYVAAAAGKTAYLWRRATAGGAFSAQAVPGSMDVTQAWYDWCLAASPADPNLLYWGAIELFRGTRSTTGWRWSNIASRSTGDSIHPDQHRVEFDPSDPQTLYACNDGGLFRSPDGGNSWVSLNPGLGITEFEFLAHLEREDAWLIGGTQDNGTLGHAGSGRWDQIAPGDGGDCGAADGDAPLCFHSYYGMWIERAPATGANAFRWTDVSPPAPEDYDALFYPPMDVAGRIVAKAGQSVFVSGDSGDNWQEVLLPASTGGPADCASALSIVGTNTIILGTRGGMLYRITRGGGANGWANARVEALATPRRAYVSDIVVPGAATGTLWATSSQIGGGHVFRSTNGGRTWTDRTGNLPDIPVNALVVDPANSNQVFAATDNGVYRTTNAGTRWLDFSNGLPNAVVGDLILHVRRRVLRAGTRNRGAWELDI
jgi:photosystem II stability/assembly factor-like uncharacterized protein